MLAASEGGNAVFLVFGGVQHVYTTLKNKTGIRKTDPPVRKTPVRKLRTPSQENINHPIRKTGQASQEN